MTTDDLNELHSDLMRHAKGANDLEERYDRESVNAARCGGKADAYRHAAELLRLAMERAAR